MKIEHIWFDFAGTLFRENEAFRSAHDKLRIETYASAKNIQDFETAKKEFFEQYKLRGSNSAVFRALGKPSDYWMKVLDKFDFQSVLKPDPEVSAAVIELSKRVPLSLFTNYVMHRIDMLLTYLDIPKDSFTYVLTGDDVPERKPALDGFYLMIKKSQLPPERILYIGDRVDVDIKPAKTVGIKTCLIYGESDEADLCANNFKELAASLSARLG